MRETIGDLKGAQQDFKEAARLRSELKKNERWVGDLASPFYLNLLLVPVWLTLKSSVLR